MPVVQDLDFSIGFGERVGIVGESGCGKSITALALMGLLPSSMSMEGSIRLASSRDKFDELSRLQESQLCKIRGKRIGMVFQEPMSALNPVQPIGHQVSESLLLHSHVSRHEAFRQASRMLERVGLPESRFP
ncbi:MAG TPA: ABC transporter ATP-binding protein, partial [Deltaproteobacteria bacterium]|nr:ABC transporter ATP-binding protein [Deltaproteobacteria bacterium]